MRTPSDSGAVGPIQYQNLKPISFVNGSIRVGILHHEPEFVLAVLVSWRAGESKSLFADGNVNLAGPAITSHAVSLPGGQSW